MTPPKLKTGNGWLTLSGIKSWSDWNSVTEQETKAIQFCKNWLNGNTEFEFQTSGSTGVPRKIKFRRDQLETSARLTAQALRLEPGYTALICLDCAFIAGAMMLVRSLAVGMNMIIKTPSANPLETVSDQIDFAALVPYQFTTILEKEPRKLNSIRTIIIGGAALSDDVINKIQTFSNTIYATYGMTETLTHVALQMLNGPGRADSFQLLSGIQVSTDSRGCLVIQATHLGSNPVVTNDLVTLLDKNSFRWIGRLDHVINSGGVKVQTDKIEKVTADIFRKLKIKNRFFVGGIPHATLGEQVTMVTEGTALSYQVEERIKAQWVGQLYAYEVPKVFLYVPHFLETATQKIDRLAILKSLGSSH